MTTALTAAVADVLRAVGRDVILPGLGTAAVLEKTPGDLVTEADRASEAFLTQRLPDLLPGSRVVGEEAVFADESVLAGIENGDVWVVDPIDGTKNYAAGRDPFATMCALVRDGVCVGSWIHFPRGDTTWWAERGGGAWRDDQPIRVPARPPLSPAHLRGRLSVSYLPPEQVDRIAERRDRFGAVSAPVGCAGQEYPDVVTGSIDFMGFWRLWPWDHLPGVLLATEAGAVARHLDGTPYDVGSFRKPGLVVARDEPTWQTVTEELFAPAP